MKGVSVCAHHKKAKKSVSSLVLLKLFYQKRFIEFTIRSVSGSLLVLILLLRIAGSFIFLAAIKLFDL